MRNRAEHDFRRGFALCGILVVNVIAQPVTVKGYVSRLMVRLDCENRTQAGLLAVAAGPVGLDGGG